MNGGGGRVGERMFSQEKFSARQREQSMGNELEGGVRGGETFEKSNALDVDKKRPNKWFQEDEGPRQSLEEEGDLRGDNAA